jgi:hypothetical protein
MRHFAFALAALTACGTATPPPTPDAPVVAETKPPEAKPEANPEPVTWKGTLDFTDNSGRMSVENYLGADFTLATDHGPIILAESAAVPRDALIAMKGHGVTVTCIPRTSAPPDPDSQYPIGADGLPLPRPSRCEVTAITSP